MDHTQHMDHSAHQQMPMEHEAEHASHAGHSEHTRHGVDHTGHEIMFRNRFWVSLALTAPVLLFSPMLQQWFGFSPPEFPGSQFVGPAFAVAIFIYGGLPFLQMAVPEVRNRRPGMMTLISLAITVAFVYSLFAAFSGTGGGFFWEMATGDETALAGIMRLVREAQQSKSDTQILADRAAGWLFYVALGVAALTAAAWIIATGFQIDVLERVVTVLVIACPHALGLAVPLVVAISSFSWL